MARILLFQIFSSWTFAASESYKMRRSTSTHCLTHVNMMWTGNQVTNIMGSTIDNHPATSTQDCDKHNMEFSLFCFYKVKSRRGYSFSSMRCMWPFFLSAPPVTPPHITVTTLYIVSKCNWNDKQYTTSQCSVICQEIMQIWCYFWTMCDYCLHSKTNQLFWKYQFILTIMCVSGQNIAKHSEGTHFIIGYFAWVVIP